MFVVIPYLTPSEAHFIFEKSSPWWAYPLFLQNFLVPISTMAAGPLGVTWSLAMEESFYLLWPLVVRPCCHVQLRYLSNRSDLLFPIILIGAYAMEVLPSTFWRSHPFGMQQLCEAGRRSNWTTRVLCSPTPTRDTNSS